MTTTPPTPPPDTAADVAPDGRRFEQLARDILRRRSRRQIALRPWLVAFWPWSWVQHRPATRSLLLAAAAGTLTALAAVRAVAAEHVRTYAALVLTSSVFLFVGMLAGFVGPIVYGRLFARLRHVALMPEEAFTRWYLAKVSAVLGHVNLSSDAPNPSLRRTLREDRFLWGGFLVNATFALVAQYLYLNPQIGNFRARLALGLLLAAANLSVGWFVAHSVLIVRFALDMARLPVRYYPDIPSSVSLKVVGNAYLLLAAVYSVMYVPILVLGYLCKAPDTAESRMLAAFGGLYLFASVVMTQVALAFAFHEHRQRKLVEYGLHVEEAFGHFMRDPSPPTHARLSDVLRQSDVLRRLPRTGFTAWTAAGFVGLVLFDVALVVGYFTLAAHGRG